MRILPRELMESWRHGHSPDLEWELKQWLKFEPLESSCRFWVRLCAMNAEPVQPLGHLRRRLHNLELERDLARRLDLWEKLASEFMSRKTCEVKLLAHDRSP